MGFYQVLFILLNKDMMHSINRWYLMNHFCTRKQWSQKGTIHQMNMRQMGTKKHIHRLCTRYSPKWCLLPSAGFCRSAHLRCSALSSQCLVLVIFNPKPQLESTILHLYHNKSLLHPQTGPNERVQESGVWVSSPLHSLDDPLCCGVQLEEVLHVRRLVQTPLL